VRVRAILILMTLSLARVAFAAPVNLRCEYLENPLGIDRIAPRLSWQSDSLERNWEQAAYEILVAGDIESLRAGQPLVWDSGKLASGQSIGIAYTGPKLESQKRYYWKVRVWDSHGQMSESQQQAWWAMDHVEQSRSARRSFLRSVDLGSWTECFGSQSPNEGYFPNPD
jgi:alpha-L-rhamnosidase